MYTIHDACYLNPLYTYIIRTLHFADHAEAGAESGDVAHAIACYQRAFEECVTRHCTPPPSPLTDAGDISPSRKFCDSISPQPNDF